MTFEETSDHNVFHIQLTERSSFKLAQVKYSTGHHITEIVGEARLTCVDESFLLCGTLYCSCPLAATRDLL